MSVITLCLCLVVLCHLPSLYLFVGLRRSCLTAVVLHLFVMKVGSIEMWVGQSNREVWGSIFGGRGRPHMSHI